MNRPPRQRIDLQIDRVVLNNLPGGHQAALVPALQQRLATLLQQAGAAQALGGDRVHERLRAAAPPASHDPAELGQGIAERVLALLSVDGPRR